MPFIGLLYKKREYHDKDRFRIITWEKTVRGTTATLYWRLGNPVIRRRRNRNVSGKKWKRTLGREQAINKFTNGKRLVTEFLLELGEVSSWRRAARLYSKNGRGVER